MKRLILVIIFIFALSPTGFAANTIPAEEILKENINIVIETAVPANCGARLM